ncbi:MAG TPA: beta-ketoacyl-[acyl-carrier-protein] synthase family protein [Pirellulales bacterium]|jgi:3-oxoacyl-[acyl-carrier-protein] synthase II|nr:beta-ketoacyl-[acyl-carrier-protein] synthase family protein [Pirellulales bacterium]
MPASARRIVITGLGLISPVGSSKQALWEALSSGRSGVGALEAVPSKYLPTHVAAEVREFTGDIENFGPLEKEQKKAIRKGLKVMCRECQMGVAAAQLAVADAGLAVGNGKYDPDRTGCLFGADYMLTLPEEFSAGINKCRSADGLFDYTRWATEGMPQLSPLWLLKYLPNMPASHVAIYNDFRGPNNSITHREAAANLAIGEAYRTILRGSADIMVVGATGTRVHPMKTIHAVQTEELAGNGVEPAKASRPFDKNRTGMVIGEGAGAIVIEELATAKARGATILAEIVGHGSSHVADRNCVAHRDSALANVMRNCLRASGLSPSEVGHIHAHGLSTRSCDIDEAKAIREVFGAAADRVPVTAAKSYFGNLGAGSGMIELIASVLALAHGQLFPVLNYETPDPECPIAVAAPQNGRADPGRSFLNLSVTPQGQASAILVQAME